MTKDEGEKNSSNTMLPEFGASAGPPLFLQNPAACAAEFIARPACLRIGDKVLMSSLDSVPMKMRDCTGKILSLPVYEDGYYGIEVIVIAGDRGVRRRFKSRFKSHEFAYIGTPRSPSSTPNPTPPIDAPSTELPRPTPSIDAPSTELPNATPFIEAPSTEIPNATPPIDAPSTEQLPADMELLKKYD